MSVIPMDSIRVFYKGEPHLIPMALIRHHPDGEKLILPYEEKDMTEAYEFAGHSAFTTWRLGKLRELSEEEREEAQQRWNVTVAALALTTSVVALYVALKRK